MKKLIELLGIIALATVIGLAVSCDTGTSDNPNSGSGKGGGGETGNDWPTELVGAWSLTSGGGAAVTFVNETTTSDTHLLVSPSPVKYFFDRQYEDTSARPKRIEVHQDNDDNILILCTNYTSSGSGATIELTLINTLSIPVAFSSIVSSGSGQKLYKVTN